MTCSESPPDPREHDHDPGAEPRPLSEAESAALGARIHALTLGVEAPVALRERLADDRMRAGRAPRRRLGLPALGLGAGALAAVVIALVLVLAGGGPAGPSVDDAVALALAPPTAPAPAVAGITALDARVDGVAFPNYAYVWPRWRTSGTRQDRISGRAATTVTYHGPRGDVGYTIVAGKALPEPKDARKIKTARLELYVLRRGDATVVTWRRDGHTCVLAGRGKGVEPQLVKFATWA
jgi:hypothetical protein